MSPGPLRIQIVAVGRLRPPLREAGELYEGRIAARVRFRSDEVAAEPLQHGAAQVLARETRRIAERTVTGAWRVALASGGRAPASSDAFAGWLARRLETPRPVAFLVGGALGLADDAVEQAEERLSLGPLTLPHQLARVVLAEQLYRALCQLAGHPYPH